MRHTHILLGVFIGILVISNLSFSFAAINCTRDNDCPTCYHCGEGYCTNNIGGGTCPSGCGNNDGYCQPLPSGRCFSDNDCNLCDYCYFNESPGYCTPYTCGGVEARTIERVSDGGCPAGCACTPQIEAPSICTPFQSSSSGESCRWYDMIATVNVSCGQNIVNVKANNNPLEGADVKILKFYSTKFSGKTNGSGQFGFVDQNGTIEVVLENFQKGENCYRAPFPMEVALKSSEDCAPKPECTRDSDCPTDYICSNNRCTYVAPPPPPPPPEPKPECTKDGDCSEDKYCSAAGSCAPVVTEKCGKIANHKWVSYTCCSDPDCVAIYNDSTYYCDNHECKQHNYDLKGDDSGYVGENGTVTAYQDGNPLGNTDLKITLPDGSSIVVTTGPDGSVVLPLTMEGDYKIELMENGALVKNFVISALPGTPPSPPSSPSFFDELAQQGLLVIIVLLLIGGGIYWYFRRK